MVESSNSALSWITWFTSSESSGDFFSDSREPYTIVIPPPNVTRGIYADIHHAQIPFVFYIHLCKKQTRHFYRVIQLELPTLSWVS